MHFKVEPPTMWAQLSTRNVNKDNNAIQIWLVLVSIYCVYTAIQNRNVVGPSLLRSRSGRTELLRRRLRQLQRMTKGTKLKIFNRTQAVAYTTYF